MSQELFRIPCSNIVQKTLKRKSCMENIYWAQSFCFNAVPFSYRKINGKFENRLGLHRNRITTIA